MDKELGIELKNQLYEAINILQCAEDAALHYDLKLRT